jgi:hypothetical protein
LANESDAGFVTLIDMRKLAGIVLCFALACLGAAEEWIGIFINGTKVGYARYSESNTTFEGKPAKLTESLTAMDLGMLGTPMKLNILTRTWSAGGKLLAIEAKSDSAGRTQNTLARFNGKKVDLTLNNSGEVTKRTIDVPTDLPVVDDALGAFLAMPNKKGASKSFYVLDPTTASFIKNGVEWVGPTTVTVNGKEVKANKVLLKDPRADTTVFVSDSGEFVRAEAPMGIEMLPVTKEVALGKDEGKGGPVDLAESTKIVPTPTLKNPAKLRELAIEITGRDLSAVPSDKFQTVKVIEDGAAITIHPPRATDMKNPPVSALRSLNTRYLKPSLHIDSNHPRWKPIVKAATDGAKDFKTVVRRIHQYVFQRMKPNAGIGILRDAVEVYRSKEGVCRDYAILTGTLMRAAGIPTRVCSGLVSWDGSFYYHAWVEVYDGANWYPIDSTSPDLQVSAAHVKLAHGNVEEAFTFPFLGKVQVKVISQK